MSIPFPSSPLDVDVQPGRVPVLRARPAAGDAVSWAADHRDQLRAVVTGCGAVLVRGLGLADADQVTGVLHRLANGLTVETETFAERRMYAEGVYSSASWPADEPMCMHHELSYRLEIPGLMLFACLTAPTEGGATGLADSAAVLESLPRDLVGWFEREGWLLVRNYHDGIGPSYAEAFGTDDRAAIEAYCRWHGVAFEWRPDGGLRTWQRRRAVVPHPISGRPCWFNQVAFLSEWTLDPKVHEFLVDVYGPDGLPFTTRSGNGDPIGPDVVRLLNEVYEAHSIRETLQAGDLMLVDNIRCAHSREPYSGSREVLVGMADPTLMADWAPFIKGAA
jgi:Taurine catabolism dioxygenase TauD, TfdA family